MAARIPQQQTFDFYQQPQWPLDTKQVFREDDDRSILDEKILDPTTPGDLSAVSDMRRESHQHIPHPFSSHQNVWHESERSHVHHNIPMMESYHHSYSMAPTYTHQSQWPVSATAGSNTPTPGYGHGAHDYEVGIAQPYPASVHGMNGSLPYHQQPQATPMSPQSSQGGWMSNTSSDDTEPRSRPTQSPTMRIPSPMSAMRPDGIRKKNARFEIPTERNLHNIDEMINAARDEPTKKELKQQKRLLRNRQAALDSRQRKKQHTEKLEQEKKGFDLMLKDVEEELRRVQEALAMEREARFHFEQYSRQVEYERDEAIKSKTLETAELRRQNSILKEHLREFELANQAPPSATFSTDFSSFDNLGIEDNSWDDEFSIVNGSDLQVEHFDPDKPTMPCPPASTEKHEPKADLPFSWNAFYMCLLFGAFIASNSRDNTRSMSKNLPQLSDEYQTESANVLKAVLASGPDSVNHLIPSSAQPSQHTAPTHITGAEMARISSQHGHSRLDAMHSALTTPSRRQQDEAAFSMTPAQYEHITNPDPFMDDSPDIVVRQPSRLQTTFASMQADRAELDRAVSGRIRDRNPLWENVPEKVLKDFREMVAGIEHARLED